MRLSHQFSAHNMLVPSGHEHSRISALIDKGLVTDLNESGFPYMTPIGRRLLENVERTFSLYARLAGADFVTLPTAMKTETLEKGQELGEQFRSKIMHLTGSLDDHHVISSPETLFIELGRQDQIAHSQLPIRYAYLNNLHRQKTNGKGALFPQQIKIFGGVTIAKQDCADQEIGRIADVVTRSFAALGIPYHQEDDYNGFDHEYFYICTPSDEGENLALPGVDESERVKAYSMGMIYDYPMERDFRLRYRDERNKNAKPALISYGFSTPRILHCALHAHRDSLGFNLPATMRPFDVTIVPSQNDAVEIANELYESLRLQFLSASHGDPASIDRVCLDDRKKVKSDDRKAFAAYSGTPYCVEVHNNGFTVTSRDGTICEELSEVSEVLGFIDTATRENNLGFKVA